MPEKQIESHNSHLARSVKNSFVPGWLEIALYVLSAIVLLCLLNYHIILDKITSTSQVPTAELDSYLHTKLSTVSDFGSRLLQGRVASMLFWAFIGSVIYMAVWTIQNLIINIRNDVKAGEFVGVRSQASIKKAYWSSIISSKVFFACSILALITFLISFEKFFMPVLSRYFGLAVSSSFHFPNTITDLLLSTLAMAALLFVLVLLVRIVSRSWRWIIGNF